MSALSASATQLGILGAGTVGAALLQRLESRADLTVSGVLVRDADKARPGVPAALLTTDPERILEQSDIVVELIGGTGLAVELMLQALKSGQRVVTANKAALAEGWDEFKPYLEQGRVYFEAAVMAGTPVIGPLSSSLRGTTPLAAHAILNGTCSYIVGRLQAGEPFAAALAEAQRLGYAEADPTLDIGGIDAAHKLALIARLAFDPQLPWSEVSRAVQGIEQLTPDVVLEAAAAGESVTLLCSIEPEGGQWRASVRPARLPAGHPLGSIPASSNALLYSSSEGGDVLISGPGAGGAATASGVLSDILLAAAGRSGPRPLPAAAPVPAAEATAEEAAGAARPITLS